MCRRVSADPSADGPWLVLNSADCSQCTGTLDCPNNANNLSHFYKGSGDLTEQKQLTIVEKITITWYKKEVSRKNDSYNSEILWANNIHMGKAIITEGLEPIPAAKKRKEGYTLDGQVTRQFTPRASLALPDILYCERKFGIKQARSTQTLPRCHSRNHYYVEYQICGRAAGLDLISRLHLSTAIHILSCTLHLRCLSSDGLQL